MADKKAHTTSDGPGFYGFFWIIVALVLFSIVLFGLQQPFEPTFLNLDFLFGKMLEALRAVVDFFVSYQVGGLIKFFIGLISLFLIGLNFWLFLRLREIEDEHEEHVYHHAPDEVHGHAKPKTLVQEVVSDVGGIATGATGFVAATATGAVTGTAGVISKLIDTAVGEKEGTTRWRTVLKHSNSNYPSDWKLAIIEADTLLDTLVERTGFPGATLGERLKNADPGVFRTLRYASEAHAVRNRIAHEGSAFTLSEREAKKTIRLYEEVFREFDYI